MGDPLDGNGELEQALELAAREARAYLAGLGDDLVQPANAAGGLDGLGGELPEKGEGALAALTDLSSIGRDTAIRSSGPRFFHFVVGGTTPASLAADWLAA